MAINRQFLLNDIASDLQDYGDFATDSGGFLERCLLDAMVDIDSAHQWDYRFKQSSIATTEGTLTGYAVPDDFDQLALEKKTNKFWAYDSYGVPPPIEDGAFGRRYPINYNEVDGTIEFYEDPGQGTRTFTYLSRVASISSLDDMPDVAWLKKLLRARTKFYAAKNTDDLSEQAGKFWEFSEEMIKREIKYQRRGRTRPDTRNLGDINGNPIYYSFLGEV